MNQTTTQLDPAFRSTPVLDATRNRLVDAAQREHLVDVAYRTMSSPIGMLLLAASPTGLVRIAFEREGIDAVLADLATTVSPRVLAAPKPLDAAVRQLDAYFAGTRTMFDLQLDLRLAGGFRRDVLDHLRTIPYGHTESYATAAAGAGRPAAVRAAASACSHNPLPLVIPCHRVVRGDGSPGEYLGGATAKRALLDLEARAA